MPEAVIVADRPQPDRPGLQGLAQGRPPRRPRRRRSSRAALDKVPGARPAATSTTSTWLRRAVRASRASTSPASSPSSLGYDHLPGATVNRFCSSSVQTTRMAFHAIKAGEGDVFVSAGVECVSRYTDWAGAGGGRRRTREPAASPRPRPAPSATAATQRDLDRPARGRPAARRLHRDGPDRRERRRPRAASPASDRTSGASRARTAPRRPSPTASSSARSRRSPRRTAPSSARTTARAPGVTLEGVAGLNPVFRPDGTVTAGNCCPLNDGAAAVVVMSDTKAARARPHAARPDRRHRRLRPLPRDHGPRPGRGVAARRSRRAGMTIDDIDLVEINEAFAAQVHPVGRRPRHRLRQAQRARRRDRARPPVRHRPAPAS